jgi:hypothetical protein
VNIKFAAATLGAALILAGSPVFAADMQSSPIVVDSVQAQSADDSSHGTLMTIAYTNESQVPATEVIFAFEANGQVIDRVDARGLFNQGVEVEESLPDYGSADDGAQIAVESVTFADGSVWNNAAVSATPSSDAPAPLAGDFTEAESF